MKVAVNSFPMRALLLVFFALLAMSQLAPLASYSVIPNEADLFNHISLIVQAAMALTDHQFPLRVTPGQYPGWSYPYFQFYAPSSYVYAGLIFKWLTPTNPFAAYKITIWTALIFAGVYLYRLVYWLTKSYPAAILAAVVMLTAPYLNILIGALGAFNEIIAISLIPFVLYYTLRDYTDPSDLKNLLLVSLGWYALITTHIITFMFSAGLIGILLFLLTCHNRRWISFFRACIAIIFSCAMATWFLVPAITLSQHFAVTSSFPSAEYIFASRPTLASILSPTLNKILNMQQNVNTRAHAALGLPILVAVGAAMYAVFINALITKKNKFDYYVYPLLIIFFIALFLLWSPVNIWQWLPSSFLVIQYTMRMMAQLIWIGPLIFAWVVCWLFDGKLDVRHAVIGVLLIFAANNSVLPTLASGPYTIKDFLKTPILMFNPDAYLIDATNSPQFVSLIDNYQLGTLVVNNKLVLNTPFLMPRKLLKVAPHPEIHIVGHFLNKNFQDKYQLALHVDKNIVATMNLQATTSLDWRAPVSQVLVDNPKEILPIYFTLNKINKQAEKKDSGVIVQADRVELTGFLDPAQTIAVKQVRSHCKYVKNALVCQMDVYRNTNLLELPMFYYPNMLKVTLNDRPVSYQGVLTDGRIIVGIVPEKNVKNIIKAKFIGLQSANAASLISWCLWLLILLVYVFKLVLLARRPKNLIP